MRRLILLRHAKTEDDADSGEDFDRALTERGRLDAARTAKALAAAGLTPDLALVSSALRARQTFDAAAPFLLDTRLQLSRALYNAPPEALLQAAQAAQADTVMVVAHNPGVQLLARDLVSRAICEPATRGRLEQGFPTAAAAVFEISAARIGCLGVYGAGDAP